MPFFRSVSAMVIHDIMSRLQREVYLGADYIVHMGEPGRALYFITKGMCSVIIEKQLAQSSSPNLARRGTVHGAVLTRQASGKGESRADRKNRTRDNGRDLKRVKVLKQGAYFGEMSLIDEEGLASAHVVAESVVEAQALLRHDFLEVLRDHPSLELAINRAIGKAKYVELDEDDDIVHKRVELQQVIVDIPLFSPFTAVARPLRPLRA